MISEVKKLRLFLAIFVCAFCAQACNFSFSTGGSNKISESEAETIAVKTLQSFNRAVLKGDFEEFHRNEVADSMKSELTTEKFNTAFAEYIEKQIDIRPEGKADINWLSKPEIDGKYLNLNGTYPSAGGKKIEFKFQYIKESGDWDLKFINIKTS